MIRPHEVRLVHKEMMYCSNQATAMDTAYGKFTPAATSDTASAASTHSDVLSTNNPESMAEFSMQLKRKRTDDNDVPSGAVADDEEAAVDTPNNPSKARTPDDPNSSDPPSLSHYLDSRELSAGQREIVNKFRRYFEALGPLDH